MIGTRRCWREIEEIDQSAHSHRRLPVRSRRYELEAEIGPVFNCHCQFCRKVHGAAFTTVAFVPRSAFRWVSESPDVAEWRTPGGSVRHFCAVCASPLCNHPREEDLLCLVVASLDDPSVASPWVHLNTESKTPWFEIADDLPQFETGPTPEEWVALAREHRATSSGS